MGEGCAAVLRSFTSRTKGPKRYLIFQPRIDIEMRDVRLMSWVFQLTGGLLYKHKAPDGYHYFNARLTLVGKPKVSAFIALILPFVPKGTEKHPQLLALKKFCSLPDGRAIRSKQKRLLLKRQQEAIYLKLQQLKPQNYTP